LSRESLHTLQFRFGEGFSLKDIYVRRQEMEQERRQYYVTSAGEVDNSFDDETLGNNIDYSSFIEPVRRLSGELEGLIIRYDPTAIPIPTPTKVINLDA
jgi:hypothetical protein